MFEGDASHRHNPISLGLRLPSVLGNRPLTFDEFDARMGQVMFISATPGDYELEKAGGEYVEQVIHPTGLVDLKIVVKSAEGQIDDLISEIRKRTERGERVLMTTLTKKVAEDLTDYLLESGVQVRYVRSDADTLKRIELLRQLCLGEYDVLVGANLLRGGLDLPEVSSVAILDADKEGFLRSERSLTQTIGHTMRNVSGEVHMYIDKVTDSVRFAIDETECRCEKQVTYDTEYDIDPQPLRKEIAGILDQVYDNTDIDYEGKIGAAADALLSRAGDSGAVDGASGEQMPRAELEVLIADLSERMAAVAHELKFKPVGRLHDEVFDLKKELKGMTEAGIE